MRRVRKSGEASDPVRWSVPPCGGLDGGEAVAAGMVGPAVAQQLLPGQERAGGRAAWCQRRGNASAGPGLRHTGRKDLDG